MKQIIVQSEEWHGSHFSVFSVPVIKVRRMAAIRTATKVIRPLKGGGYFRKEKFDKGLTSFEQSV
jgi:hypothetical protein